MEKIKNDKKLMIMEQIKNNKEKELMLIIAIAVLIVLVVVIASNKLSANQCIGKWEEIIEVDKINKWTSIYVIELYEGGTGKITSKSIGESYGSDYDITWEIKDNILNITDQYETTTGYKLKNKILTTVDGNRSYNKVK